MVLNRLTDGSADVPAVSMSSNIVGRGNPVDLAEHGQAPSLQSLSATAERPSTSTIESLPNELLANIFGYLDAPPPSASGLLDEPTFEIINSEATNLKAISLVSKRWRLAILPELFKHSRFIAHKPESLPRPVLGEEIQPLLGFIRKNSLEKVVTSFVLVVQDEKVANNTHGVKQLNGFAGFWTALFQTVDPVELLIIAPAEALGALTSCHVYLQDEWSFDNPCQYLRLQQPPIEISCISQTDKIATRSTALEPATDDESKVISTEPIHNSSASLLRRPLLETSSQPTTPIAQAASQSEISSSEPPLAEWEFPRAETSALFDIRSWSTLLLNEGSFVKAYSTYEFWLRQPPSILAELVGADETSPQRPYISPTIRDFSYIGIFPQASHFNSLTTHLPRLDRLYVQLVPRNDILDNPVRMEQVESEDLWMERNSCYALLMRELFNAPPLLNYKYLEVFESGDAADTDAWNMAVEYVKRAGNGWKVAGDGIFIRDPKDLAPEPIEGEDEEPSSFQGALIKWAWNGITKLPVSAYPLYDRPMGPLM